MSPRIPCLQSRRTPLARSNSIRYWVRVGNQWLQSLPDTTLLGSSRRIVIGGEHRNTGIATTVDNGSLTGEVLVAVDSTVDGVWRRVCVAEDTGGFIADDGVGSCAASELKVVIRLENARGL